MNHGDARKAVWTVVGFAFGLILLWILFVRFFG